MTSTIAATPHTDMNINAVTPTNTVPTQWDVTQMYPIIFNGQKMEEEKFKIENMGQNKGINQQH